MTYLLQDRNILQMVRRSGVVYTQRQPHNTRCYFSAARLVRNHLCLGESLIQRRLRDGAQCEEVLRRFDGTGEVPKRGDSPRGFPVKQSGRHTLISSEGEAGGVDVLSVD